MADPMNFDDEEDDVPDQRGGALGQVALGKLTPEQMQMPDNIKSQYDAGQKMLAGADFEGAAQRQKAALEAKKQALIKGREALMAQPMDKTALYLSMMKGFLSPTRTGSFFESLGNAGGEAAPAITQLRQQEAARNEKLAGFDLSSAGIDADMAKTDYDHLLKRADLGRKMSSDALKADTQRQTRLMQVAGADERARQADARTNIARERLELAKKRAEAGDRQQVEIEVDENEAKALTEKYGKPITPGTHTFMVDPKSDKPFETMTYVGAAKQKPQAEKTRNVSVDVTPELQAQLKAQGLEVPLGPQTLVQDVATGKHVGYAGPIVTGDQKKGDDKASIDDNARRSAARELNVPYMERVPWRGFTPSGAQREVSRAAADYEKFDKELQEEEQKADEMHSLIREFGTAQQRTPTGGAVDRMAPSVSSYFNDDKQVMEKVTARLGPMQRIAGTGAVSDFDAKQLLKQVPSIGNNPKTNQIIMEYYGRLAQNVKDRAQFMRSYYEANRTLQGASGAWREYINANPWGSTGTDMEKGVFVPNEKRQTWQEYFKAKNELAELEREAANRKAKDALGRARGGRVSRG